MGHGLAELVAGGREAELVGEGDGRVEEVAERLHVRLGAPARVEHGDVWPVCLVPRKGVKVDTQGLDVDRPVWSIGDAINANEGADPVGHRGNGFDVCYGPEDVACVRARNQPRLGREELFQVLGQQFRIRPRGRLPPLQSQALPFGQVDPRGYVGLVVNGRGR